MSNLKIQILITKIKDLTMNRELLITKSGYNRAPYIHLVEFTNNSMVLEAPSGICRSGDHLLLVLRTKNTEQEVEFECTVKVNQVEPVNEDMAQFDLKLIQFDALLWKKILRAFEAKQDEVTALLQRMKG